jgi:hypothetical protein
MIISVKQQNPKMNHAKSKEESTWKISNKNTEISNFSQ